MRSKPRLSFAEQIAALIHDGIGHDAQHNETEHEEKQHSPFDAHRKLLNGTTGEQLPRSSRGGISEIESASSGHRRPSTQTLNVQNFERSHG